MVHNSLMDLKEFYKSMDKIGREQYALAADTTPEYIRIHLITKNKTPKKELMVNLAKASNGKLSVQSIIDFFYRDIH